MKSVFIKAALAATVFATLMSSPAFAQDSTVVMVNRAPPASSHTVASATEGALVEAVLQPVWSGSGSSGSIANVESIVPVTPVDSPTLQVVVQATFVSLPPASAGAVYGTQWVAGYHLVDPLNPNSEMRYLYDDVMVVNPVGPTKESNPSGFANAVNALDTRYGVQLDCSGGQQRPVCAPKPPGSQLPAIR